VPKKIVSQKLALTLGVLINVIVISLPLLIVAIDFTELMSRPASWIFYFLISLFCLLESNASFGVGSGASVQADRSFLPYLIGVLVLLLIWVSLYEYSADHYLHWQQLPALSILVPSSLILIGIFLRVISIKTLNRFFLSHIGLVNEHKLITTGIYSLVRHPSEAGLLLICLAVPILLGSLSGLMLTGLLIVPLCLYRIHREDRMMFLHFNDKFVAYKLSTPALLPRFIDLARWRVQKN